MRDNLVNLSEIQCLKIALLYIIDRSDNSDIQINFGLELLTEKLGNNKFRRLLYRNYINRKIWILDVWGWI